MFKIFGNHARSEQNEQLLLISESVKSGMPLSKAIRLIALEDRPQDRPFLKLADLLDQGTVPNEAVVKAGFPSEIRQVLLDSLDNPHFADFFSLQTHFLQLRQQTRLRIMNSIAYPLCLICIALVVFQMMLIFIVPQFKLLFISFDTQLPSLTECIIGISDYIGVFYCIFFLFVGFLILLEKTLMPYFWYKVPCLGTIRYCMFQGLFFRSLAFSLKRGIPLPDFLTAYATRNGSRAFRRDLRHASEDARKGCFLYNLVLRYPHLFPIWLSPILLSCQQNEEQVGAFEQAAELSDGQMQNSLGFLQTGALITALLFVFVVTGQIVVSMFLPMIRLVESLSK